MNHFRLLCVFLAGFYLSMPLTAQDLTQPYIDSEVLVRFAPGAATADRAVARGALLPQGGRALGLVPGLELIQTGLDVPQAIAVLSNNPNVLYVEPNYLVQPIANDYYFNLQWGLENNGQDIRGVLGDLAADIDMLEAWAAATVTTQTVVAVIDTGTQWDHEDLADKIWWNLDETPNGEDSDGNGFVDDIRGRE